MLFFVFFFASNGLLSHKTFIHKKLVYINKADSAKFAVLKDERTSYIVYVYGFTAYNGILLDLRGFTGFFMNSHFLHEFTKSCLN